MIKYLCIKNKKMGVEAEWLPRWYNVPFEECIMIKNEDSPNARGYFHDFEKKYIILRARLDNNYDIKIAKTEHLLNGGD